MARLDRTRPYGEHWGAVGLSGYTQDGRDFGLDGKSVDPVDVDPAVMADADSPLEPAEADPPPVAEATGVKRRGRPPKIADSSGREVSDDELRTKVEIAGGMWTGRRDALSFLGQTE